MPLIGGGNCLNSTTGLLTILVLLTTLVLTVVLIQVARAQRRAFVLRRVPAYAAMPMLVSEALEADRTIHFSFGSIAVGGSATPLLLANAEAFNLLANRAVLGTHTPLMTTSEAATLPLSYDILRRAYRLRRRTDQFRIGAVQWYPEGTRSLAFAAALTTVMGDEQLNANVLMGSFGPELALILEAAARRRQSAIAASDQLEGQAVAFAMSDEKLIGEEMFAGGAYLGGGPAQVGGVVAMDALRVLLIATLLLMAADRLTAGEFLRPLLVPLSGLLGGGS